MPSVHLLGFSTATAPKPSGSSTRRRSPLSDLNSRDASAARERPGCFRFLLPSSSSSTTSGTRSASTPRTPKRPDPKPRIRASRRHDRLPDQESRTRAAAVEKPRRRGPEPIGGRIKKAADPAAGMKQQWPARRAEQQLEALTPEKKAAESGSTPPVHASISPEVAAAGACGSATPACFAAGHHVLPGVGDHRKCRPRGSPSCK